MEKLIKLAKELVNNQEVRVVIGYGVNARGIATPIFAQTSEECEKLIHEPSPKLNLAVYLTRHESKILGKPALIGNWREARAILQLAAEKQVSEGDLIFLAVDGDEVVKIDRFDDLVQYVSSSKDEMEKFYTGKLEELKALPAQERFDFWTKELSYCFKCYACRSACPLCYCTRCTVDNNRPQWIPVASHPLGNLEWHLMRAMHLAGRCADCGACQNACPISIPLNIINKGLSEVVKENFGDFRNGLHSDNPLSSYRPNDHETFIR